MAKLTMDKAERLIRANVTEAHLFTHALAVSSAMGAMAQHFGEDKAHWQAVDQVGAAIRKLATAKA